MLADVLPIPPGGTAGPDDGELVSLYVRLSRVFRDRIAQGEWPPGSRLPTLPELCREYGAARVTVRLALALLSARGLIVARRGVGTVVQDAATALDDAGLRRAINDPAETGSLAIEVLGRGRVDALPPELGGDAGPWRHWRKRHRHQSAPFVLMDVYVRREIAATFPRGADRRLKLVQLLQEHRPASALREEIRTSHATPEVAGAMECALGEPLVRMRRWYSAKPGRSVMAGIYLYRADRFVLEIRRELSGQGVEAPFIDGGPG